MADDVLIWDRHMGGHARFAHVQQSLPMLKQPVLTSLKLEWIDHRPGVSSMLREHACGSREMTGDERRECDVYLHYVGAGGLR